MSRPTMIVGAPGTGKTFQLVERIKREKPDNFALLTFTRQAAAEARARLTDFFSPQQLRYVRTIHSLAFELLGLTTDKIYDSSHHMRFGDEYGYFFKGRT